jgi:diguanylate cyclase (GGDEF)-like protein/PAS domain S-box-containing protein
MAARSPALVQQQLLDLVTQFQQGQAEMGWVEGDRQGTPLRMSCQCSHYDTEAERWVLVEGTLPSPAEQVLREERQLFTAGPVIIFKWQPKPGWPMEYVSQNVQEQLGYSPEQLTSGQINFADLIHPDDLPKVEQEVWQYINAGADRFIQHYRLRHGNGDYRWLDDYTVVVRDDRSGDVQCLLGYVLDKSDRQLADATLAQSEATKRAILAAIPDLLVCINRDGVYHDLTVGEGIKYWKPDAEVTPKTVFTAMPYEMALERMQCIHQALDTGQPQVYDQTIEVDGELRYEEARVVPFSADEVLVMVRDITDRVLLKKALIESERRFHAIFDQMYQFIGLLSPEGILLEVNQAVLNFMGAARADVVGRPMWDVSTWRASAATQDQLKRAIAQAAQGEFVRYEVNLQNMTGQLITLDFSLRPIFDESGNVVLLIPEGRDMSDRKQTEVNLRQQKELLQVMFDHFPIMVELYNQDCTVQLANREIERVLGWPLDQVLQQDFLCKRYPDPIQRQQVQAFIIAARQTWQDFTTYTADGTPINTSWMNIPLSTGQILSIGQDITQRKEIEAQLRMTAERDRLLALIVQRIRQSLELQEILHTTVTEIRLALQSDRAMIYQLNADYSGHVLAEAVGESCPSFLGQTFKMPSTTTPDRVQAYQQGHIQVSADIYNSGLPDDLIAFFSRVHVRATLIVPILHSDTIWGFIAAFQQSQPREWQTGEVDLVRQVANQVAIAIQQAELYQQLQHANRELQYLATHDKLTGLANRRHFDDYLQKEWLRLSRERSPIALLLCDIDHFKLYNDTYGHIAGDDCLAQVADAICRSISRPADMVARYGGEEFAIVLPNTDCEGAVQVAQKVQQHIHAVQIPHASSLTQPWITLSIGIVTIIPNPTTTPQALIDRADDALYSAKSAGRNGYAIAD